MRPIPIALLVVFVLCAGVAAGYVVRSGAAGTIVTTTATSLTTRTETVFSVMSTEVTTTLTPALTTTTVTTTVMTGALTTATTTGVSAQYLSASQAAAEGAAFITASCSAPCSSNQTGVSIYLTVPGMTYFYSQISASAPGVSVSVQPQDIDEIQVSFYTNSPYSCFEYFLSDPELPPTIYVWFYGQGQCPS